MERVVYSDARVYENTLRFSKFACLQNPSRLNQPSAYFLSHNINEITRIDSKVVIVEYDKPEDVHELICIDV
jgi:hypothetical protein